jgi:hypothetical protein
MSWSELGTSLTKTYRKGWDAFVKDIIVISKKLISTVILVFLKFYFVINKKSVDLWLLPDKVVLSASAFIVIEPCLIARFYLIYSKSQYIVDADMELTIGCYCNGLRSVLVLNISRTLKSFCWCCICVCLRNKNVFIAETLICPSYSHTHLTAS